MKRKILIVLGFLFVHLVIAQVSDEELNHSRFQFTFISPPLSTNGNQCRNFSNEISINLLVGINGGVEKFEAGSLINIDKKRVSGTQLSGLLNFVNGKANGLQIAGFGNYTHNRYDGVQLAGFYNINKGQLNGTQLAGFLNLNNSNLDSNQISGPVYINGQSSSGIQIAGFTNIDNITGKGTRIAGFANISAHGSINNNIAGFMNIAEDVKGLQLAGFMNTARNVEGVQISGFINISDSTRGFSLAFINIPQKQLYSRLELSTKDFMPYNLNFKLGSKEWYNIYSVGKLKNDPNRWAFGFGFGSDHNLVGNISYNLEDICYQELWINEHRHRFLYISNLFLINELNFKFNYHLNNDISIFAGPSYCLQIRNKENSILPASDDLSPSWLLSDLTANNQNRTNIKSWIGFSAGIGF